MHLPEHGLWRLGQPVRLRTHAPHHHERRRRDLRGCPDVAPPAAAHSHPSCEQHVLCRCADQLVLRRTLHPARDCHRRRLGVLVPSRQHPRLGRQMPGALPQLVWLRLLFVRVRVPAGHARLGARVLPKVRIRRVEYPSRVHARELPPLHHVGERARVGHALRRPVLGGRWRARQLRHLPRGLGAVGRRRQRAGLHECDRRRRVALGVPLRAGRPDLLRCVDPHLHGLRGHGRQARGHRQLRLLGRMHRRGLP